MTGPTDGEGEGVRGAGQGPPLVRRAAEGRAPLTGAGRGHDRIGRPTRAAFLTRGPRPDATIRETRPDSGAINSARFFATGCPSLIRKNGPGYSKVRTRTAEAMAVLGGDTKRRLLRGGSVRGENGPAGPSSP